MEKSDFPIPVPLEQATPQSLVKNNSWLSYASSMLASIGFTCYGVKKAPKPIPENQSQ